MNSVIMDNVELGDDCIIGALTFIKEGERIPGRSLVAGNPARIIREVSEEMIAWKSEGTKIYQSLPGEMFNHFHAVEPIREIPVYQPEQQKNYQNWKEHRKE